MKTAAIFNPIAGRGRAAQAEAEFHLRLPPGTHLLPTTGPGHAIALAEQAARDGCERIIAVGGDGTVNEVANGILRSEQDALLAVLPVGSANDYAFTLGLHPWWKQQRGWDELSSLTVDVGRVRTGGRTRYFVNSCGVGFNGMVTMEARKSRWLRGVTLYSWAVLKTLYRHYRTAEISLEMDEAATLQRRMLVLTIGLAQREGGFPLALQAKLDDGLFDWLHVGDIARWELIRYLPAMIRGNLPTNHPKLEQGTSRQIRLSANEALCVHTDGELFTYREDQRTEFEFELLPRRLRVAVDAVHLYGKSGPREEVRPA